MEKLLTQIIGHGRKRRDDCEYISELLFNILVEFEDVPGLVKVQLNNEHFIDVKSIPDEIRDEMGLFISFQLSSLKAMDEKYMREGIDVKALPNIAPSVKKDDDPFAESDVRRALKEAKNCEHEFIDYFVDQQEIKKKSITLSLLKTVVPNRLNKKYLMTVFKILKKDNVECEFPLDRFDHFYRKLKWFSKVGWANGCISTDYNPTI